jgi:hypothetical protein
MRLNVFNSYTYTLETIIQAGRNNIPMTSVPVRVNGDLRPSRLVKSNLGYVVRSLATIVRIFVIYKPFRFFFLLSVLVAAPGLGSILRFLYFYLSGDGGGHVQSLVIAAASIACAAMLCIGGLLVDLIAANRALLEDLRTRQLRFEIESGEPFQAMVDLIARADLMVASSPPYAAQTGDNIAPVMRRAPARHERL